MIIFRPLIRYADFRSRASRAEYWLFNIFQGFWYSLLFGLTLAAMGQSQAGSANPGLMVALGLILLSIVGLIIPNYAVLVRRLHDSGRGIVWLCLLLPSLLTVLIMVATVTTAVGAVGMGANREMFVSTVLTGLGAAGLLGLIGMVGQMILSILTLLPGTPGPNRFGPDPRTDGGGFGDHISGGGLSGYDEDRLEALFAQARREQFADQGGARSESLKSPHRPVFDFSPGSTGPMIQNAPIQNPQIQTWPNTGWEADTTPARPFGRRGA